MAETKPEEMFHSAVWGVVVLSVFINLFWSIAVWAILAHFGH